MGSGCSSPLKRFGGKRGKTARRESSPFEANGEKETTNPEEQSSNTAHRHSHHMKPQHKFIVENEVTIQSEINDDHPSTASYYTDSKIVNEETKISEQSGSLDPKHSGAQAGSDQVSSSTTSVATRIMGLNGSYTPHDRYLLVSPALSPAPSTCYSPTPISLAPGSVSTMLDINDLNEAFKTLTFGLSNDHGHNIIKQPSRQLSEVYNYYAEQLVQSQHDLISYITVILITTDNFQFTAQATSNESSGNIETLAYHIESYLKSFCDEHLFNLRFLNLSHAHLSEQFQINNLLDASMHILEQEYQHNSQRIIMIVLSNNTNSPLGSSDTTQVSSDGSKQHNQDKRQLPGKIEAQSMNKLQSINAPNLDPSAKDLLKRWYNQLGNIFYLKPIYQVYPKISSESKEERSAAWQSWLNESDLLIKAIELCQESDPELIRETRLKSLFASHIEFLLRDPALCKKTLLIRNYVQPTTNTLSSQPQQMNLSNQNRDSNLNELTRLLADPNKLTLKRPMNEEEYVKTVIDWIYENFNKFVDSILENQIIHGKHVPPFIDRNLFFELTCQRQYLERYLDNITESFESKCNTFYNVQILPILDSFINGANSLLNTDSLSSHIETPPLSSNHLVFISGPKGCGKSTLFAQIIKSAAQNYLNKAQIIYRFCGLTLDSLTPNRVFRSICEQFCQTQGENITAASYIYSARKEVINALNKIIKQQTVLIFLDGLDFFKPTSESDSDWLCEIESNSRIKIFIMLETDSDLYKKVLGSCTDATYISLDYPTFGEWAQMLNSNARSKRFNSSGSLYDEIKSMNAEPKDANLSYTDISNIISICRIRRFNNEFFYPELSFKTIQSNPIQNLKNLFQVVLSHLHYLMSPYLACTLIVILDSSRNGLYERDIINIMTMISQKSHRYNEIKFSSALLNYVKIQLQPWLTYILCDKAVKLMIHKDFAAKSIEHYVSVMHPNIVNEIRDVLLDYFNRSARSKSSKTSASNKSDLSTIEPRDYVSSAERLWLATRVSETINLLILTNPSKAREHMMNKHQFFLQFLYGSMPEEFIEDYGRLKDQVTKKSNNEDLQCLVSFIKQSIYPLRYDGSQIYSQIYCRASETIKTGKLSKSRKLNEIFSTASCPPIRNLLPISENSINSFIKTRIGQSQPTTSLSSTSLSAPLASNQKATSKSAYSQQGTGQLQAKQKIYTIKDNHRHVIVIYPDKDSLSVWDIFEEKAVRTINNLDQPRDLKMIDNKCAVILCNRELRVYDLHTGLMLTKLKGVMNQKMPFFEVFGENYVVALARNRMYVNMLNLNTGELETTFKVGEDRFLNSLLVSANGGICVCGDETQKPFPLLVWDLNERRLLYDLRLDKHEFITKMSAISDDGHFVVSVCRQLGDSDDANNNSSLEKHKSSPNFIVIYDLSSGTLFKKWKPGLDSCGVAISLSATKSGKVINTIVDSSILVWDLATGSKKHVLIGHSAPADVIKVQNSRLFSMDSTCRDQNLRIWDIEEGYCLAVFSPDAPINCCQMSIRGDALICGFAAETRLSSLVMCKNETVGDVVKQNKRRKSSKTLYVFDEPPSRKSSS